MRRAMGIGGAALAVLAGACGGAAGGAGAAEAPRREPVTLAVSLEPGAEYEGSLVMTQELPTRQQVRTRIQVRTRVLDATDGMFTVEDQYGDLRVSVDGQPVESEGEMQDVDEVRIRYDLDPRGRTAGEPQASGVTDANREFAQELLDSVGEEAVPFPEGPVAPGDTWEGERAIAMPTEVGELKGRVREVHRLERVESVEGRAWAVIDIGGDVTLEPLEGGGLFMRGAGRVAGKRRVLLGDGFTSDSDTEVTLTLHVKAGSGAGETDITQRTGTELRIRRVDGEARGGVR
ncbi:MAG: hypothetical protein ACODAU_02645 [Myxococcota bacterium]